MDDQKNRIFVKRQKNSKGSKISFLKEIKTDGTPDNLKSAIKKLMEAKEPYFEVIYPPEKKLIYTKKPYQQNFNKKEVKLKN